MAMTRANAGQPRSCPSALVKFTLLRPRNIWLQEQLRQSFLVGSTWLQGKVQLFQQQLCAERTA